MVADPKLERGLLASLLLVMAVCCTAISWSTVQLQNANADRREQLEVLERILVVPGTVPVGPIVMLDGLYDRQLCCVDRGYGATVKFAAGPGGAE